jgi:two-component system CheB/CheR fusion protein
MPYRTFDDRIGGLVITFINNSDIKQLEGELLETEQAFRLILSSSSDIIVRLSTDLRILEFNPEAEKFFGKKRKDLTNQKYIPLFVPEKARDTTENDLNNIVRQKEETQYKMKVQAAGGNTVELDWAVHILLSNLNIPAGLILIARQ